LVDIASAIATGHEAAVVAHGSEEKELEKRLGSMLLAGVSVISIDNCEHPLGGELLCQMLTQARVRTRILGVSETPELSPSAFIAATGNNLLLQGDLTRRAILCRLDPKVERPETRTFKREPVATAKAQRGDLVVAALTVLRAYHMAGRPGAPRPLGSFETWSDLVRGALLWMGAADPVVSMIELRKADPRREAMQAVCAQWEAEIGPETVTVAEVIRRAIEMRHGELVRPDLREALLVVAGKGGALNSRALGNWLSSQKDRIVDGFCFTRMGDRQGVAAWALAPGGG
jgi:putative DNA primase/helicase